MVFQVFFYDNDGRCVAKISEVEALDKYRAVELVILDRPELSECSAQTQVLKNAH
ncbi:MAG: hypothetical protein QG609_282 [Patescibacteria group bacterium]|nr:hypothetical protein [Patescibacteria group bacterium]